MTSSCVKKIVDPSTCPSLLLVRANLQDVVDGYSLSGGSLVLFFVVFFALPFLLLAVFVLKRYVIGLLPHVALLNIAEQSP